MAPATPAAYNLCAWGPGEAAMNWRIGFFRLWAVFSLLWILGFGGFVYVWPAVSAVRYEVTGPSDSRYIVTAPAGTPESEALAFVTNSDEAKKREADCTKERGPWCEHPLQIEMPSATLNPLRAFVSTMSVPMLILAVGLLCFWVVSGFQKSVAPKS
jgi:hypothetical protein